MWCDFYRSLPKYSARLTTSRDAMLWTKGDNTAIVVLFIKDHYNRMRKHVLCARRKTLSAHVLFTSGRSRGQHAVHANWTNPRVWIHTICSQQKKISTSCAAEQEMRGHCIWYIINFWVTSRDVWQADTIASDLSGHLTDHNLLSKFPGVWHFLLISCSSTLTHINHTATSQCCE